MVATRLRIEGDELTEYPIPYWKVQKGRYLEDIVEEALNLEDVHRFFSRIERNPINGLGADFVLWSSLNKPAVLIEVKNWSDHYKVRPYWFREEVISRFRVQDPEQEKLWILVIPYLVATQGVLYYITEVPNLYIIQTGIPPTKGPIKPLSRSVRDKLVRHLAKAFKGVLRHWFKRVRVFHIHSDSDRQAYRYDDVCMQNEKTISEDQLNGLSATHAGLYPLLKSGLTYLKQEKGWKGF